MNIDVTVRRRSQAPNVGMLILCSFVIFVGSFLWFFFGK